MFIKYVFVCVNLSYDFVICNLKNFKKCNEYSLLFRVKVIFFEMDERNVLVKNK